MKILFELFLLFFKVGILTFGGGYVMFMLVKEEIVEKRKWLSEKDLIDFYAISSVTPGVIAVNVATFVGYKLGGKLGGIVATLGVIAPSLIIASLVITLLQDNLHNPYVESALNGVKVVVTALLAKFLTELSSNELKNIRSILIFAITFALLYFMKCNIVFVFFIAAMLGYSLSYRKHKQR